MPGRAVLADDEQDEVVILRGPLLTDLDLYRVTGATEIEGPRTSALRIGPGGCPADRRDGATGRHVVGEGDIVLPHREPLCRRGKGPANESAIGPDDREFPGERRRVTPTPRDEWDEYASVPATRSTTRQNMAPSYMRVLSE
jgi:hypothetical protein